MERFAMIDLKKAYKDLVKNPTSVYLASEDGKILDFNTCFYKYSDENLLIMPGSFNPLHYGHLDIYNSINDSHPLCVKFFELSISRVGKPDLTLEDLKQRLKQFIGVGPVVLTNAPYFIEKIGLLANFDSILYFHVGVDTITRLYDDYGKNGVQGLNAKFVVYDRSVNGKICTLYSELPDGVPNNCRKSLKERSDYNMSISSTKIRNGNKL